MHASLSDRYVWQTNSGGYDTRGYAGEREGEELHNLGAAGSDEERSFASSAPHCCGLRGVQNLKGKSYYPPFPPLPPAYRLDTLITREDYGTVIK